MYFNSPGPGRVMMSRRVKEFVDISDHVSLDDLIGKLAEIRAQLPEDLIFARTSDQPRQVEENIHLFMGSLYEAIILVVVIALVGFWEWRSALDR